MYIGELSKLAGVTIKAIRHYEKIGLIPPPRREGRYRVFVENDVKVIIMIKEAKQNR